MIRTEARRQESSSALDAKQRAKLGQYFTPAPAADFIASLARLEASETIRVLDPGAGVGSLTADDGVEAARSEVEQARVVAELTKAKEQLRRQQQRAAATSSRIEELQKQLSPTARGDGIA
ncbi:DNA methyltransferase family protein [Streptomyces lancefieldiae]|uniref:hypothetical protein n=1 Tax=Streptomyces lancefieldiae TaxID=3075520 RepID=UPI00288B6B9D|nr:hypothetical protein [Streptomyces sp. DSM 40712]